MIDHTHHAEVQLVAPEILAQRAFPRPGVIRQRAADQHLRIRRREIGGRAIVVRLRQAPLDQLQAQRLVRARPAQHEIHHADRVLETARVVRDAGGAGLRTERHLIDHGDRLHARDAAQAGQHARIDVRCLAGIEAIDRQHRQRAFVDTAVDLDQLPALHHQETRVAQHGASQRNFHGDQQRGEPMATQGGEYGSNLHGHPPHSALSCQAGTTRLARSAGITPASRLAAIAMTKVARNMPVSRCARWA